MADRIIQTDTLQGIANALRGGESQSAADKIEVADFGTVAAGLKSASDGLVALIGREATSFTILEGITLIGDSAFSGYYNLESITIPEGVNDIGSYAFKDCTGLGSITIPEGITIIRSNTFNGCISLAEVNLPSTITRIVGYAFYGCMSLGSITIPEGVTYIGASAFYGCTNLAEVNLPSTITEIDIDAFANIKSDAVINCGFSEGAVSGAPWGAPNTVTINYDVTE